MASLFLRSNGVYYVSYRVGDKRKQRSTGCRDHGLAKMRLEELQRELEPWEKISLSRFRRELTTLIEGNVAPRTVMLYNEALKAFERTVGDLKLHSVSAYHIELFKSTRSKEVAAATVARDYRHLKAAFRRACLWKMIEASPFTGVRNVRVPEAPPQYLSAAECAHLVGTISSPAIKRLVIFAVSTGLRIGETVNLRWIDLDLKRGLIHVTNRPGFTTKNRRSRTVPMNKTVEDLLSRLPRHGEYVFVGERGGKLNSGWVSRKFKEFAREAGLSERIHFHSLRHTFASWLVQSDVPVILAKEILGHSSIGTTLVYARIAPGQLKESVRTIDTYLADVWHTHDSNQLEMEFSPSAKE